MDSCVIFCAGGFEKLARQPDETDFILAADGGLVYCGSERSEVVMEADSAELTAFAVEEEAFFRNNLDASESESGPFCILQLSAVGDGDCRSVHIPVCINRSAKVDFCTGVV